MLTPYTLAPTPSVENPDLQYLDVHLNPARALRQATHPSPHNILRCFSGSSSLSGNVVKRSLNRSIGAASIAAKFSKYGLFGALGWLLVGVNIFVLSKLRASACDSSLESFSSKRGISSSDSCLMCEWRSVMRRSRRREKVGEEGERDCSL